MLPVCQRPNSSSNVKSSWFPISGCCFRGNFVMFLNPCHSQTSHGHIHPVQRISVRSGLSQYPFVNLVGKSSALECPFSGLGGKTHTVRHTNVHFPTYYSKTPTFRRKWEPEAGQWASSNGEYVSYNWDLWPSLSFWLTTADYLILNGLNGRTSTAGKNARREFETRRNIWEDGGRCRQREKAEKLGSFRRTLHQWTVWGGWMWSFVLDRLRAPMYVCAKKKARARRPRAYRCLELRRSPPVSTSSKQLLSERDRPTQRDWEGANGQKTRKSLFHSLVCPSGSPHNVSFEDPEE